MKVLHVNLSLCLLLIFSNALGQKKIIDRLLSSENDSSSKSRFIVLPALGYAQETGFEYGLVTLNSFQAGKDSITRGSTISGLISLTTKNQSFVNLKPDIWTNRNRYHIIGDVRYRYFPFNFYGIGNDTYEDDKEKITQKIFRLSAEVEKNLAPNIYAGINFSFERQRFTDVPSGGLFATNPFIEDKDGGKAVFAGISQVVDSRSSNIYTTNGLYLKTTLSFATDIFDEDDFSGALVKLDYRNFKSLNRKSVLGINANYQTIRGKEIPFYLLPQMGNDQVMRGYYTGRYRDKNLLATQSEFRYRIIPRLGLATFLGLGTVFSSKVSLKDFKPSYGAGIRYFFDTLKGLSLRMDYAFGEKQANEARQQGFYLSLGEAF